MANISEHINKSVDQLKGELATETNSDDVLIDRKSGEVVGGSAKNRLPFGLCKKYGIQIGDSWTPRDAWNALKDIGIDPSEEYEKIQKRGQDVLPDFNSDDISKNIETMINSDRVYYDKAMSRERFQDNVQAATSEMQSLTAKLFNDDSFAYRNNEKTTAYYPGFNKVCMRIPNNGGEEFDSSFAHGQAFYHETWHAIDNNYAQNVGENISTHYVASTGRTLEQTLLEETARVDWEAVKSELDADINEYYRSKGIDRESVAVKYRQLRLQAEAIGREQGIAEKWRFEYSDDYIKVSTEYDRMNKVPAVLQRKWGDLSDIYDGYRKGNESLTKMAHGKKYWRQKGARANEAFAEIASSKATAPNSYKIIQKYLPETVKTFEEIFNKLQKGEFKNNGRPKYKS